MNKKYQERVRSKCSFLLLNVGYEELYANWNWQDVCSPFARIYFVTDGEAVTIIDGEEISLRPGYLYLTPPFVHHDDYCNSKFSLYYIHLFDQLNEEVSIFKQLDLPLEVKASPLDLALTQRLMEINPNTALETIDPNVYDNMGNFKRYIHDQRSKTVRSLMETDAILTQLLAHFVEHGQYKGGKKDKRLNDILNYIHTNIHRNIDVSTLADIACTSNDHLIRIFKKEMNTTPLQYINTKKMEKAQIMLLTTEKPIKDIALELAIDNVSYFNRIFKRTVGKSPSDYRDTF